MVDNTAAPGRMTWHPRADGAAPGGPLPAPGSWFARLQRAAVARETLLILPEFLLITFTIAMLWAGILATLSQQRREATQSAYQVTASLARAYDESTRRIIGEGDQTLLSVRAFHDSMGPDFSLQAWAHSQTAPNRLVPQVALIGPTGWLTGSTYNAHPKPVDLSDRPHFIAQKESARDRLYISVPVVGRVTGKQTIQLTRKLLGPQGQFAGVAVVSIDCRKLSAFYSALGSQPGVTTLLRSDGTVLARGPILAGAIGRNIAGSGVFRAMMAHPSGHLKFRSAFDHVERYVSYRRVAGYPLIVAVGLDRSTVFRDYWIQRARWHEAGWIITVVLLGIGLLWMRQRRRSVGSRRALVATLQAVNQGIVMIDPAGRIPVVNRRALELLGVPPEPDHRRTGWRRLLARWWRADHLAGPRDLSRWLPERLAGMTDRTLGASEAAFTGEWQCPSGQVIEIARTPIPTGGVVETYTDVTANRAATRQIRHLAHHDGLTGLPNRLLLQETLAAMISAARTAPVLLLLVDLDRFKEVNDTLGHATGDRTLVEVAGRLRRHAGQATMVARMGGDEFVLLLHATPEDPFGERLGRRLVAALSEPMRIGYHEVRVGASVGIADEPGSGGDVDSLLRNADIALYRAKAEGRGTVRRFDPSMVTEIEARTALEADLRAAIEAGEIEVEFEAQIETETLIPSGFEALARWRHPARGAVPPMVFIPLAEECGLIHRLGAVVLRRACAAAMGWPSDCRVAVNISPAQLLDVGLPNLVRETLATTGLAPDRLELEITEGVLLGEERRVLATLHALKQMGVRLVLDDFGTGYSSLSYLLKLPVDRVKIDKSFVQRQPFDPAARAIVEAIIELALHLGLALTAEGVETEQHLAILRQQGCSVVQGWLFARPMREDAIVARFWPSRAPPGVPAAQHADTAAARRHAAPLDMPWPSV
ncbi:MAG: EAL domain-containing protein [Rhodospirillales bacterium]|nr:EAL domain-containing protein [Rhodospirillales bacterium]